MKIALYIGGRITGYDEESLNTLLTIQNKYNVDIFMSINQAEIDEEHQKYINTLKPIKYNFEISPFDENLLKYPIKASQIKNMSSMYYTNYKCIQMIEEYQNKNNFKYDIVIKFRSEIYSISDFNIIEKIDQNTIYVPNSLEVGFPVGINDHIAYGNFESMKIYSSLYNELENLAIEGCILHPETILYFWINKNKLNINKFYFAYGLSHYKWRENRGVHVR